MARVGGEIDGFCTRCEMVLAHTVVAMVAGRPVKVQCNTCRTVHRPRGAPSRGAVARPRSPRPRPAAHSVAELLDSRDPSSALPYSPAGTYAVDDLLRHPEFGLGLVTAVRPGKVEVAFRSAVRTLVHARAGGGGPVPASRGAPR